MGARGMRVGAAAAILTALLATTGCGGPPSIDDALPWPAAPAALGYLSGGDIVTHGDEGPQPIASLAKVVSALVVLEAHPLEPGETGPEIMIDQHALADAAAVAAAGGVTSRFTGGQLVTQHDLLACSLIVSASDCSDTLARWAFGSTEDYVEAATAWLAAQGLDATVVTDASGLDGDARGTARDMVALGRLALADPVVADLVASPEALVAGRPFLNTNDLLMVGFTGIKTGTDHRSHLLFSRPLGDDVVIGAVLGADNAAFARRGAVALTDALLVRAS